MSESRPDERYGGIAAVLAHPDDESFGCAGALALAHDAHRAVRLLVATRGEAGTPDGVPDEDLAERSRRRAALRRRAHRAGRGDSAGGLSRRRRLAEASFSELVDDIALWLSDRQPDTVVTFGAHGVTGHPDHVGDRLRHALGDRAAVGAGDRARTRCS